MNVYEGDTEEDQKERANKTATAKCTCEESQRLAVIGAARQVFELNIDKAVLEVADSTITIKPKGDGLTITRKSTLEIGD